MRRFYGVRLRDLFLGEPGCRALTHRELIDYLKHLPRDCALARDMFGEAAEWGPEMHRITDLADLLIEGNYIAIKAAGGKAKKPKPIPRPDPDVDRERGARDADESEYIRRRKAEYQAELAAAGHLDEAGASEPQDPDFTDAQDIAVALGGANGHES